MQAGDALLESRPQVVGTIWKGCCEAIAFSNDPPPVLTASEQQALNDLRGGVLPPTDECNFITYWLLLATPWPRSVAVRAGFPAAAALGALFDATNVRPALLRRMAAAWLTWSENALNENLGPTWQAACATGKYPVVNGPPRVRLPKPPRAAKRGKPLRRRDRPDQLLAGRAREGGNEGAVEGDCAVHERGRRGARDALRDVGDRVEPQRERAARCEQREEKQRGGSERRHFMHRFDH